MKAAQFTLTSTVLAAALALGLAVALGATPAAAGHKPSHSPGSGGGGGGGIVYTAELTAGAFVFHPFPPGHLSGEDLDAHVVVVTPNNRGIELRSNTDLDMIPPGDDDILDITWNAVFNACEELLGGDPVVDFFVANDEWRIAKAGGVRVIFRDIELQGIELQGAEVRVQLIGEEFEFIESFLPEFDGETRVYVLTRFEITGTPVRGRGAIKSCRGSDGGGDLGFPSTLVIRAVAVAP